MSLKCESHCTRSTQVLFDHVYIVVVVVELVITGDL